MNHMELNLEHSDWTRDVLSLSAHWTDKKLLFSFCEFAWQSDAAASKVFQNPEQAHFIESLSIRLPLCQ